MNTVGVGALIGGYEIHISDYHVVAAVDYKVTQLAVDGG